MLLTSALLSLLTASLLATAGGTSLAQQSIETPDTHEGYPVEEGRAYGSNLAQIAETADLKSAIVFKAIEARRKAQVWSPPPQMSSRETRRPGTASSVRSRVSSSSSVTRGADHPRGPTYTYEPF